MKLRYKQMKGMIQTNKIRIQIMRVENVYMI